MGEKLGASVISIQNCAWHFCQIVLQNITIKMGKKSFHSIPWQLVEIIMVCGFQISCVIWVPTVVPEIDGFLKSPQETNTMPRKRTGSSQCLYKWCLWIPLLTCFLSSLSCKHTPGGKDPDTHWGQPWTFQVWVGNTKVTARRIYSFDFDFQNSAN